MKYRVQIGADEDGVFVAECPALPGCVSQGSSRAEALANIKDAMSHPEGQDDTGERFVAVLEIPQLNHQ